MIVSWRLLEKILACSEDVYRCLIKIHPKEFRAEYEKEMVQNFRDLCREQLDRDELDARPGFVESHGSRLGGFGCD